MSASPVRSPVTQPDLPGIRWPVLLRQAVTWVVAGIGGYLCSLIHLPLAWMIGALAFSSVLSWGFAVSLPARGRALALVVLGTSFGTGMTPTVFLQVLQDLPVMAGCALLTLTLGAALTRPLARFSGLEERTAFFCAVPGGVTVMPILAEAAQADTRPVTLSQTVRMVLVVLTIPLGVTALGGGDAVFLATATPVRPLALVLFLILALGAALLIARARVSNPWILGPLIFSMVVSASVGPPTGFPHWLINLAQVAMGAGLGVKLNRGFVMSSHRLLAVSAISTLILIALLASVAYAVAQLTDLDVPVVLLGMAPGGTPEMVVTAAALGVAVPMVLGFHLVRMLASNLLIGPMWRLYRALGHVSPS